MKYPAPFVHIRMYQSWVIFLPGWSQEKADKFAKKYFNLTLDFDKDGVCHHLQKGNNSIQVIYLRTWKNNPAHLALLGHEVIHACLSIFEDIDQPIEHKGKNEFLTYLFQDIFQGLLVQTKGMSQ